MHLINQQVATKWYLTIWVGRQGFPLRENTANQDQISKCCLESSKEKTKTTDKTWSRSCTSSKTL